MPDARKRPCSICRHWFRPDPRVGARQRACGKPECQAARRSQTQARWRAANPGYAATYRIDQRHARKPPPEPLRVPAPLDQLPWEVAKDEFGAKGSDFIGLLGRVLLHSTKDQFPVYRAETVGVPSTLPPPVAKDQRRPPPY